MKLTSNMKVVCICRGGQVRSVAARYILSERFGFRKVLACGWEKNDHDTVEMLCRWADAILIVGSAKQWVVEGKVDWIFNETALIDIGPDVYHRYNHPELINILTPIIEAMVEREVAPA